MRTLKYVLEYKFVDFSSKTVQTATQVWRIKHGRPTEANIKRWREDFVESVESKDGCNRHLLGKFSMPGTVTIRLNKTNGATVAKYVPPMFELI